MSHLIPNLDALHAKLPPADSAADAHEFVQQLATAGSVADIHIRVDALVDRWLEVPLDSE